MPPWPRFQPPPRHTPRAAFPHCAFLRAACRGLGDLACGECLQPWSLPPVIVAPSQVVLSPLPPPPLPAAAPAAPCTPQVTSDRLCHPLLHNTTTPARLPSRTIAPPAPQARVQKLEHPIHGLGLIPANNLLQLAHQCRALLQPGRRPRPPGPLAAPCPPAVTAHEAQALSWGPVHAPAFLRMDGDLERGQCVSAASVHGLEAPSMRRRGLHQEHEVLSNPRLCAGGRRSTAGDRCGPRQPPIHCRERQMTEERREHPAWRTSLLARRVPHPLEPLQHVRLVDPRCALRQEPVRPEMIDGRVSIHVHDAGLGLHHRPRHAQDRLRGGALGARAGRTRLAVRCTDGCQAQRAGSLDHTVTARRQRQHPDALPPCLGTRLVPSPPGARRAGGPCLP